MKNLLRLICVAGSGFLLSGCVAFTSQNDIGTLKLQMQELNKAIVQMQSNQAELAGKIDEVSQNVMISNENLSQLDTQLSRVSAKLDDMTAVAAAQPQETAAAAKTQTKAAAKKTVPVATLLPSDLFAEAKNHLDKGAYEPAATGFNLYVTRYPEAENVERAYMYMGDAYMAAGQTRPAAVAYATLLQKFPQSKWTATARLKYARSILPLGKTDEAKQYLSSIVQEFPTAPEAKLAKAELAKLNG